MEHFDLYLHGKRLTLAAVAAQLGVDKATVHRWRVGKARPDYERAAQVAEWSGGKVPVAAWIKWDEVPDYAD